MTSNHIQAIAAKMFDTASIRMNLAATAKLALKFECFIESNTCLKCVTEEDGSFIITSDSMKFLSALTFEDAVYYLVDQTCLSFYERFKCSIDTLMFFIGSWARMFLRLIDQGVPLTVARMVTREVLSACMRYADDLSLKLESVENCKLDAFLVPFFLDENDMSSVVVKSVQKDSVREHDATNSGKVPCADWPKAGARLSHPVANSAPAGVRLDRPLPFMFAPSSVPVTFRGGVSRRPNFYSRHVVADVKISLKKKAEEALKDRLRRVCACLCPYDDVSLRKLFNSACALHLESVVLGETFDKVDFFGMRLEPVDAGSSSDSVPLTGLLIPVSDWLAVDVLKRLEGRRLKLGLVNTKAHGTSLPLRDTRVALREVTAFEALGRQSEAINFTGSYLRMLKDFDVSILVLRGTCDESLPSMLLQNGIVLLSIDSYSLLKDLSVLTSSAIAFGFDDLGVSDIGDFIQITVVHGRKRMVVASSNRSRENEVAFYIAVQRSDLTPAASECTLHRAPTFTSVLVHGGTSILRDITIHKLEESFNRVNRALDSRRLVRSVRHFESSIVNFIRSSILLQPRSPFAYDIPCVPEVFIYWRTIAEQVVDVFQRYVDRVLLHSSSGSECSSLREATSVIQAWSYGLQCVEKIICANICINYFKTVLFAEPFRVRSNSVFKAIYKTWMCRG